MARSGPLTLNGYYNTADSNWVEHAAATPAALKGVLIGRSGVTDIDVKQFRSGRASNDNRNNAIGFKVIMSKSSKTKWDDDVANLLWGLDIQCPSGDVGIIGEVNAVIESLTGLSPSTLIRLDISIANSICVANEKGKGGHLPKEPPGGEIIPLEFIFLSSSGLRNTYKIVPKVTFAVDAVGGIDWSEVPASHIVELDEWDLEVRNNIRGCLPAPARLDQVGEYYYKSTKVIDDGAGGNSFTFLTEINTDGNILVMKKDDIDIGDTRDTGVIVTENFLGNATHLTGRRDFPWDPTIQTSFGSSVQIIDSITPGYSHILNWEYDIPQKRFVSIDNELRITNKVQEIEAGGCAGTIEIMVGSMGGAYDL